MKANRWNLAQIARAISAVLLLSLLHVIVAPVLAPQLLTPIASAADANDLPSGLGTVYQFLAESYTSGSTTWPEARGGTGATISATGLKVTNTAGTLGASKSVVAVQGSYQTTITFPTTVAYGNATNPNDYTFFHVARYAPQQTGLTNANYCDTSANHITNNAAKKNRIFSSTANNWLSGFWACSTGVAYHYGWVTQSSSAVSELSGNNGNNWLLSADCGYVSSSSSGCNGRYRAFGTDRTLTQSTSVVGHSVIVNGGQFPAELSDFQIAEVISYPTILSVADIVKVETYLARKYGITLSSGTATKLGIHRASVGTTLNEPLTVQPQVAIQDSNGQTVTTDNSTIITATVTGLNGRVIGTATASAIQGIATFDNLGVDGLPGNSYTITYTSNGGLTSTSESRVFTRGGGSETDTALSLSGSQYLSSAQESPFDIATGTTFTLEAWVKPTITNANQILIGKANQYSLYIYQNGSYGMNFYTTNAGGSGGDTSIFRAGSVLANQWQHVAVVRNGTSVTGYVNGQALATFTNPSATDAITAGSSPFVVGGYSTTNQTFTGQIDQVRVWSSARTAAEIQSGMSSFIPATQTGLIASYGFNESTGTKIYNYATSATSDTDLDLNGGSSTWSQIAETSTVGAYSIVTFRRSYLTTAGGWKAPSGVNAASVLVLAGGGAGGTRGGGGGGAGGYILKGQQSVSSTRYETITVGQGGVAQLTTNGSSGQDSRFGATITAAGGGSGGGAIGSDNTYRAGINGGSGGGAAGASGVGSAAYGYGNTPSTSPAQGNNGGSGNQGTNQWPGGGGGGITSAGANGSGNVAGTGGGGIIDPLSSSSVCFATGGGGGIYVGLTAGAGGNCSGVASPNNNQGTAGSSTPTPAKANTGSGGGGSGWSGSADQLGGDGGSGIVIIRWITALKPIFTGPNFDTLTAGLVETFTVSGTSNSPLTRSFRWQSSNDTGTTWSNASTGSGFLTSNYVTPTLETTTSGIRYQFRVVVTDSDTAGLFIVDTSTAVYLTINPRNTITSSTGSMSFTQKYGESRTVVFTFAFGTGTRTPSVTSTTNNQNGKITWSNLNSESATVRVGTGLSVGTYSETLTVTDSVTAFTTQALSITVSKADTITITTTLSISSVTYTESPAAITATQTFAGLVNSETGTATTTYMGNTCEYGGTCVIGDIAPGGGYVFYVSATTIDVASGISTGGIYLATAPKTWSGGSADPTSKWGCAGSQISGTFSSAVGSGAENTRLITAGCATAGIAAQLAADASAEGFTDWFIPSIGELNLIYTNLKLNSLSNLNGTDYWSSTQDASSPSSYAQYQWFGGGSYGPTDKNNNLSVRAIRAFSPTALVSNTIPTDAGVYKVGSTFAISSPASLGNYLGVESVTATLTINKARQKTITIGQYDAYPNISSYPLNVYGGSGPGTVTRTLVSAGTAGCSLTSAFILTATSTGTCTVKAEKAGTRNYIVESTTAVIYWIAWSNNYAAQTIEGNHAISVSGSNGIVVRTETVTASAFSNTSGGAITSAAIGATIRINSTGFSGLSPSDLSVTFRPYEDAVITAVTSTYVEVVIPAGASTGVIAIDSPRGVAYTQSFTIAP